MLIFGQRLTDSLLSKTKTGHRKNIIPLEVKSAKRFTQISLNKFCAYIDLPMVLDVKDFCGDNDVKDIPIYATPAILESI